MDCKKCVCNKCINNCRCQFCSGSIKECDHKNVFEQISMFPQKKMARFFTWDDYGISKKRYKELKQICQSGKYDALVRSVVHTAAPDIKVYIYLSVTKNMSYRALEAKWELGEMERMPYNHNDFYGYRRLFYHLFDERIRKNGGRIKSWE